MSSPKLSFGSREDPLCPHCNKPVYIDWRTEEYGDPKVGEENVECPHCKAKLLITSQVEYRLYQL